MNASHYDPQKLIDLRKQNSLTQDELAKLVDVDRQTIYRAEAGRAASYELLCAIADLFKIDRTSLLHPRPLACAA